MTAIKTLCYTVTPKNAFSYRKNLYKYNVKIVYTEYNVIPEKGVTCVTLLSKPLAEPV
jgi:hypothetical protein